MLKTPLNTRALTAPLDRSAVRDNAKATLPRLPADAVPGGDLRRSVPLITIFAASIAFLGWTFSNLASGDLLPIMAIFWGVLLLGPAYLFVAMLIKRRRAFQRWWRLKNFAADNAMQYDPWTDARFAHDGTPFRTTGTIETFDLVTATARSLRAGRIRTVTGSGRSRTVTINEYVSLRLTRDLPHIVLDGDRNNGLGGKGRLGREFDRSQRLSLEGNFDEHFTLYAPAGYEADALYLFTPDIMQRMIDHATEFDVEIVGDRLYFYAPSGIVTTDPERWQTLAAMLNAMEEKLGQWERWSDTRLEGHRPQWSERSYEVASPGQRLRQRVPWWAFPAALLSIAWIGWSLWQLVVDVVTSLTGTR